MAKTKETNGSKESNKNDLDQFTQELINSINSDQGDKIAYNLENDDAPTNITRWVSTGSKLLDFIISRRTKNGGIPEGRITEIFGPNSIGKSHIATQIGISAQKMGGICVYIDTENATNVENLQKLGVRLSRLVYCQPPTIENCFQTIESTIVKARSMQKDVPIVVVWDSIAASSPKEELEGDYDKTTIGLAARALSKGFRKITQTIGNNKISLILLNQTREKVGGMIYGDPSIPTGGKAIGFYSSVRIKLGAGSHIKDKDSDQVVGIMVRATTIKNKVNHPFRDAEFELHFGVGIREHEQIFDILRVHGEQIIGDNKITVSGEGAWKTLEVLDKTGKELVKEKFYKSAFLDIMKKYPEYIEPLTETALEKKYGIAKANFDISSLADVQAIQELQRSQEF